MLSFGASGLDRSLHEQNSALCDVRLSALPKSSSHTDSDSDDAFWAVLLSLVVKGGHSVQQISKWPCRTGNLRSKDSALALGSPSYEASSMMSGPPVVLRVVRAIETSLQLFALTELL